MVQDFSIGYREKIQKDRVPAIVNVLNNQNILYHQLGGLSGRVRRDRTERRSQIREKKLLDRLYTPIIVLGAQGGGGKGDTRQDDGVGLV